jgi:predicted permease
MTIALELQQGRPWQIVMNTLRGLCTNPVIVALALGFSWNMLALPLPSTIEALAKLLGQAAAPCALFATGAALSQYRIAGNLAESLWLVLIKIIIQPILVWLLAHYVFQLPPLWTAVAVLIAALPTGVNAYLFAQRYKVGIATATTTIFLSTALSLLTLPLVLWLLSGAKPLQ